MASWRLTGLYGEPDRTQCRKTWDLLRHLARDSNLPWCVIGDLNNVCSQLDKKGGASYPTWLIEGFNEILAEIGLIDMDLVGASVHLGERERYDRVARGPARHGFINERLA